MTKLKSASTKCSSRKGNRRIRDVTSLRSDSQMRVQISTDRKTPVFLQFMPKECSHALAAILQGPSLQRGHSAPVHHPA
eukprot:1282867-Amphidinium_carterae.1